MIQPCLFNWNGACDILTVGKIFDPSEACRRACIEYAAYGEKNPPEDQFNVQSIDAAISMVTCLPELTCQPACPMITHQSRQKLPEFVEAKYGQRTDASKLRHLAFVHTNMGVLFFVCTCRVAIVHSLFRSRCDIIQFGCALCECGSPPHK